VTTLTSQSAISGLEHQNKLGLNISASLSIHTSTKLSLERHLSQYYCISLDSYRE